MPAFLVAVAFLGGIVLVVGIGLGVEERGRQVTMSLEIADEDEESCCCWMESRGKDEDGAELQAWAPRSFLSIYTGDVGGRAPYHTSIFHSALAAFGRSHNIDTTTFWRPSLSDWRRSLIWISPPGLWPFCSS